MAGNPKLLHTHGRTTTKCEQQANMECHEPQLFSSSSKSSQSQAKQGTRSWRSEKPNPCDLQPTFCVAPTKTHEQPLSRCRCQMRPCRRYFRTRRLSSMRRLTPSGPTGNRPKEGICRTTTHHREATKNSENSRGSHAGVDFV